MSSIYSRRSYSNVRYFNSQGRRALQQFRYYIKKHPVSHLYDYCRFWKIRPKFSFTELQQLSGIEYICIVMVEQYLGEGRAFNKKTSKALAASDILEKLIYGEDDIDFKRPERYVSQTFSVSLVADCSLRISSTSETSSNSENENYNDTEEPYVKMEESNSTDLVNNNHTPYSTERLGVDSAPVDEMEVDSRSPDDQENNSSLLEQINHFCNTDNEKEDDDNLPTPKADVVRSSSGSTEASVLMLPDPVEYLNRCCREKDMSLPFYKGCITNGKYVSKCIMNLGDFTYGKGETLSEAKRISAQRMIESLNW